MDFLTLTLLLIICYSIYYYFKKKLSYFEDLGVPYAPGWPLIGNFAEALFRKKHTNEIVQEIYDLHPDAKYVGAFNFGTPAFVLRDPELIKNVAIKHFDSFPDHIKFIDDQLDPLFGGALFNMAGDKWKEARNLLSPAFTSSKMKSMYELMVAVAKNFVGYIKNMDEADRRMMATKDLFAKYTNDVIASCAFGIIVDSLKNPKNEFYILGKEATGFDRLDMTIKFFIAGICPSFLKFFKIRLISESARKFFTKVVSETISIRDEKGISRPDMLQLMMDARGRESKHLKLDIEEMTAQAFIFFFGGFDTTSTQMSVMAHELAINPDTQEKLQREIDDALRECDGKATYELINGLPYLDAVFNEALRLHSQFGFLDRLCTKSFELPPAVPGGKPIAIEPGTYIWIPQTAIQRDPTYFEEPDKFMPERFYQKKITTNDATNLGFGIGPRACIGNRFALLEIKILFFYLLSEFNMVRTPKTCSPLTYSKSSFAIKPEGGFWLAMEPRDKK